MLDDQLNDPGSLKNLESADTHDLLGRFIWMIFLCKSCVKMPCFPSLKYADFADSRGFLNFLTLDMIHLKLGFAEWTIISNSVRGIVKILPLNKISNF